MNLLTRKKIISYLAVIFLAGGVSGSVLTWQQTHPKPKADNTKKACRSMQDHLKERLELTPEQVARLQPVFDETVRAIETVHRHTVDEIENIISQAHSRVAVELTPEQARKLEAFDAERREYRLRHDKRREAAAQPGSGTNGPFALPLPVPDVR